MYALGALKHLSVFDRVIGEIEDTNSMEAVAAHVRRAIAGSRVVFLMGFKDDETGIAFKGEENRISFVTDADSRLEYGGLYLVQIGLSGEEPGPRRLVQFRRVFRPSMAIEPGDAEPILLAENVKALNFRYFGSPEEGAKAGWHAVWPFVKALPRAVEVTVAFDNDRRRWPPMIVTIPAAR